MQHPATTAEDDQLIKDLFKLSQKNKRLVKAILHNAPADNEIKIHSWKMDEFKYSTVPCPFPTYARGLFTVKTTKTVDDDDAEHRIIVRGYDKFFNIGEVPWNTWEALERNTVPPYVLTLKSNGCIIFIGALTPSQILITSKHSLGNDHASVGGRWLRKYLVAKEKTEEDLAAALWEKNWTAVAELCDDSFEEHVLPITPEKTGLHLHGINESTKAFKTMPQAVVDEFAEEWGFIKTPSVALNSIPEVRKFTTDVSSEGSWMGEPVEGFVVRTHVSDIPPAQEQRPKERPPYPGGSTFFFKVKFDEPYMMYRDWREVTKILLSNKGGSADTLPKSKMRRPETKVYVQWVMNEIKRDRSQFARYTENHGIIDTRERFLTWLNSEKGKCDLDKTKQTGDVEVTSTKNFGKTIIIPVAIPGCGKTAVSVALAHIFGFGHTQSDDVGAKKAGPAFIKNVVGLLKTNEVVIADKNNHLRIHRKALRDAVSNMVPPVKLLALDWPVQSVPQATVHRICSDRVMVRGDNHQSLTSSPDSKSHEEVIWMFINTSEELLPNEVDDIVEMNMEADEGIEGQVIRAAQGISKILGLEMPSAEKIKEGAIVAMGYSPTKKAMGDAKKGKEKEKLPRYFGLLVEIDPKPLLDRVIPDIALWKELKTANRVNPRPHVTLVHSRALKDSPVDQAIWDKCMDVNSLPKGPLLRFKLGNVVWNDRVMAITIDDVQLADDNELVQTMEKLELKDEKDASQLGKALLAQLTPEVRKRLHITIGTKTQGIMPIEAKMMVENWRAGNGGVDVKSVVLNDVEGKGRVKGLIQ